MKLQPLSILLLTSVVLIALGVWGYFTGDPPTPTSLMPPIFGLVFLIALPLLHKQVRHSKILIPVLIFLLIPPIIGYIVNTIVNQDWLALARNIVMLMFCCWSFWALSKPYFRHFRWPGKSPGIQNDASS